MIQVNSLINRSDKLLNPSHRLKVFISSKIGDTLGDQKYVLARAAAKKLLEDTGLFKVYLFESEGASTNTALDHYTHNLIKSDVCIFLIDNKDGVPGGVYTEYETVSKHKIPSFYYFCESQKKAKTSLQIELSKADEPKYRTINSFEEFIEKCSEDLINDILFTYGSVKERQFEENEQYKNSLLSSGDKANKGQSTKTNLGSTVKSKNNPIILRKDQLNNIICRNYFLKLIFRKEGQKYEKRDFDYYCSLYLPILFEGANIENFNMSLFLEKLKETIPRDYFEIVSKRWASNQKYYLEEFDESIELLKEAYELAEKNKEVIAEWFIQDILIDLRNRYEVVSETKNEYLRENFGQIELDKREEKLYYPLIDRLEKNLLDWIEKERQKEEIASYTSQTWYGDMSMYSNHIADIFFQSMMFGSLTHLERIYSLIQKLTYQLCTFTDYWPWFTDVFKNTILSLDKKKIHRLTRHFDNLLEKMNADDAKEIYEYSDNSKPSHKNFCANLIAMSEVGYYLDDAEFLKKWGELESKIRSWDVDENSIVVLESYIFDCIKKISERVSDDFIVEFCIQILKLSQKRYFDDVLKILSDNNIIDYSKISEENLTSLTTLLIHQASQTRETHEIEKIKQVFINLGQFNNPKQKEYEKFIEKQWPEFYQFEYLLEIERDQKNLEIFVKNKIEQISSRNKTQGKNGVYSGYGNNPFTELRNVLYTEDGFLTDGLLDNIFNETSETILRSNQRIEEKISAYQLLILLCRYNDEICSRNLDIVKELVNFKEVDKAHESMMSYIDKSMLSLAHFLLLECFGKNKINDIMNLLPVYIDQGSQITACKLIQTFLFNYDIIKVRSNLENLLLQYGMCWINSESVEVRWHAIHLLLILFHKSKHKTIVGFQIKSIMDTDNAFIKSQILHKIEEIQTIDKKLAAHIIKKAKADHNYVVRKIAGKEVKL